MTDAFPIAVEWLGPIEGVYSTDRADPGNWTGGAVGVGEFKGTKYGISAKQYPEEDIPNLTKERAHQLYRRDYWEQHSCQHLPPALGLILFDSVVQHSIGAKMFQRALRVKDDGIIGPNTIKAAWNANGAETIQRLHTARRRYYQHLVMRDATLGHNLDGWFLRLEKLHAAAAELHWREELANRPLDVPQFLREAR